MTASSREKNQSMQEMEKRIRQLEEACRLHVDALARVSSLGDFHASIKETYETSRILEAARFHVQQFLGVQVSAFMMVKPEDGSFVLTDCEPASEKVKIQEVVDREIDQGTFAWALQQNHAVIIRSKTEGGDALVFHVVATRSKVWGMFVGLLKDPEMKSSDVSLNLLSVMMMSTAYALENANLYREINEYNANLERLVETRTQELSQANEELIKSKKLESIAILAGGIAHDYNNMLAVIIGNLSLAKRVVNPDEKLYSRLGDIEQAALRAKDLTAQLLTFSKGGAPIRRVTRMSPLVHESVGLGLRGSTVQYDEVFSENVKDAEIDEGQMRQVFLNLTLNAVQAMTGGGRLTVTLQNTILKDSKSIPLADGEYVRISLQDTGAGIPAKHLTQIFDPFFTLKKGRSGMGLAIVYSIVKKHGGHVTVESEENSGSTFHVYLPASSRKIDVAETKIISTISMPSVKKCRVMVMDDEAGIREFAGVVLREMGHETCFATNGEEAIDLYARSRQEGKKIDLLIMDLTIPGGMGGKDAIQKLIQMDPQVRAIVSSGYSSDPVMSQFEKYGFKGVLPKPYKIADMMEIVGRAVTP